MNISKEYNDLVDFQKIEKEKESEIFKRYESISNYGYEIDGYKRVEDLFNKFVNFYYENKEKYLGKIKEVFLDFEKLEEVKMELKSLNIKFGFSVIRFLNIDKILMSNVYFDNIEIPNDITISELIYLIHEFIEEGFISYEIKGEE